MAGGIKQAPLAAIACQVDFHEQCGSGTRTFASTSDERVSAIRREALEFIAFGVVGVLEEIPTVCRDGIDLQGTAAG